INIPKSPILMYNKLFTGLVSKIKSLPAIVFRYIVWFSKNRVGVDIDSIQILVAPILLQGRERRFISMNHESGFIDISIAARVNDDIVVITDFHGGLIANGLGLLHLLVADYHRTVRGTVIL